MINDATQPLPADRAAQLTDEAAKTALQGCFRSLSR